MAVGELGDRPLLEEQNNVEVDLKERDQDVELNKFDDSGKYFELLVGLEKMNVNSLKDKLLLVGSKEHKDGYRSLRVLLKKNHHLKK